MSHTLNFFELAKQSLTQPRAVIREVVDTDPTFMVSRLILYTALLSGYSPKVGVELLIFSLLISIVFTFASTYLTAGLLWLSGKWIGGKAPLSHLLAVMAWSLVPTFLGAIIQLATAVMGDPLSTLGELVFLVGLIWSMKLIIWMLAEVQHFSLGRAVLNTLLATGLTLLLLLPFLPMLISYVNFIRAGLGTL